MGEIGADRALFADAADHVAGAAAGGDEGSARRRSRASACASSQAAKSGGSCTSTVNAISACDGPQNSAQTPR